MLYLKQSISSGHVNFLCKKETNKKKLKEALIVKGSLSKKDEGHLHHLITKWKLFVILGTQPDSFNLK